MKKGNCYKLFYVIAIVLLIIFLIVLGIDYKNYDPLVTSAPFGVNILVRSIEFLLPSIVLFVLGFVFKKKYLK